MTNDTVSCDRNTPLQSNKLSIEKNLKVLESVKNGMQLIPKNQRPKWVIDKLTEHFGSTVNYFVIEMIASQLFNGDSGNSMDVKPDWLDMEKFRRGQKFAQDYAFNITYNVVLSVFISLSFEEGLKPLISTGKSSTPYTSFKRYLSTGSRFRNWYLTDPWQPGTLASKEMTTVRRMHMMVRNKLSGLSPEELAEKTTINNPCCPALGIARKDFQSNSQGSDPAVDLFNAMNKQPEFAGKFITQNDMMITQFSLACLCVTYPEFYGIYDATDEDFEAFCHTWRGLGYLIGIEDDFNMCRGTLSDVRARTKNLMEHWVKPNLQNITPQWEHMMRCIVEGFKYYVPDTFSYEGCLLDLAEMMDLNMPLVYNSMSYSNVIKWKLRRFYFTHGSRLPFLRNYLNNQVNASIDRALSFDEKKHKELQKRSEKTLEMYTHEMNAKKDVQPSLVKNLPNGFVMRILLALMLTFFIFCAVCV